MNNRIFFIGLLSVMAVSCTVNELTIPEENGSLHQYPNVIHAVIADQPGDVNTKVFTGEDLYVRWNADDHINYFDKYSLGYEYCFAGEEGNTFGDFEKVDDGNPGEGGDELDMVYAVYPFRNETTIDDKGVISYILPNEQYYPWENSFGRDANTMVSSTETEDLKFKNVGGYLSFKLYGEGVNVYSITLKGNNGELLSGKCTINSSSGEPIVTMDSEEASNKITLICDGVELDPESSNYMEFWMVIPPTTFSKGITFRVETTDGGIWSKSTSASFSIGRNVKKSVPVMEVKPEIPENIVFADALVEEICVKYWDENEDGGLSYDEAAAVKTLMVDEKLTKAGEMVSAFAGTGIFIFGELVYFTCLTEIDAGAFEGCTELTSITIPENVEVIGDNAFKGCTNLEFIKIDSSTPPTVGNNAFDNTNECPIYVPVVSVEEYESALTWNAYAYRIQENSVSFKVPLTDGMYHKTIGSDELAAALGISESQLESLSFGGFYAKDGDNYYALSASEICGTAEMVDGRIKWSIDYNAMKSIETIIAKFTDSQNEFYLPIMAEKAPAPSFTVGNKIRNEWYSDIGNEAYNTYRFTARVPRAEESVPVAGGDVTKMYRDLNTFFIVYMPYFSLSEDSDSIYGDWIEQEMNPSIDVNDNDWMDKVNYTYSFSSDQPVINEVQLVVSEDGRSLYAGSITGSNLLAYIEREFYEKEYEDGTIERKVIDSLVYNWQEGETVAKELLNLWSTTETDEEHMFYANMDLNYTYGASKIPVGKESFHVRFMRPIDIVSSTDVLSTGTLPFTDVFSSIKDWNNFALANLYSKYCFKVCFNKDPRADVRSLAQVLFDYLEQYSPVDPDTIRFYEENNDIWAIILLKCGPQEINAAMSRALGAKYAYHYTLPEYENGEPVYDSNGNMVYVEYVDYIDCIKSINKFFIENNTIKTVDMAKYYGVETFVVDLSSTSSLTLNGKSGRLSINISDTSVLNEYTLRCTSPGTYHIPYEISYKWGTINGVLDLSFR